MAQLPDDEQSGQDLQTNRDPAWNALQDLAPEGPAHEAVSEIVGRLNDYQQKSELVQANEQAGANFVNDISGWKNGMEAAVKNDPLFVHTAMDVTVPFLQGTAGSIPGADPAHVDTLIRDMHHDLSTLSVYTAAERNGDLARSLLGNERIAGQLSEDEKGALDRYIGHQEDARARDSAVQLTQAQRAQEADTADKTLGWATLLSEGTIPPNWHASVLADQNIPVEAKGTLGDLASKLIAEGDNQTSNAFALTDMVNQIAGGKAPSNEQLMQMVTGGQMTMADMEHLSTRGLGAMTPLAKREAGALAATLDAAQSYLLGPNNQNGMAGARAYGRFTDWLMREYQGAGPGSLDPRSENWILQSPGGGGVMDLMNRFYPKGGDVLVDLPRNYMRTPMDRLEQDTRDRPSLSDIFASGGRGRSGDQVLQPPRRATARMKGIYDYDGSPFPEENHFSPRSEEM